MRSHPDDTTRPDYLKTRPPESLEQLSPERLPQRDESELLQHPLMGLCKGRQQSFHNFNDSGPQNGNEKIGKNKEQQGK
jgi:hypothetical protein